MSTEIDFTVPIALARLVRKPQGYLWVVDSCPFCHQRHIHGGGDLDGDPYAKLIEHAADCWIRPVPEPSMYLLVAAPDQEAP